MFKSVLQRLLNGEVLTEAQSYEVMCDILEGRATPTQIGSLITFLSFRKVEVQELTGLTRAMREYALGVQLDVDLYPIVDTCGTGGAGFKTFNVSTISALVASASGLPIAKHGNRAATSVTGSADVLEELGLPVSMSPEDIRKALKERYMCFMFAPLYHQSMKHAAPPRKELGFRSVFNLLGPLTNPAGTKHQVIGVLAHAYIVTMAKTLLELGSEHVLIVQGEDGLDEFSISVSTRITELRNGGIEQYTIAPEDVGLHRHSSAGIRVANPAESASLIRSVLRGENKGAAYDMTVLNAGAALYVGGKANEIAEGVQLAKALIDSGEAERHFFRLSTGKGAVKHA
jgi:anthranilate phosphoribosyltransferase